MFLESEIPWGTPTVIQGPTSIIQGPTSIIPGEDHSIDSGTPVRTRSEKRLEKKVEKSTKTFFYTTKSSYICI